MAKKIKLNVGVPTIIGMQVRRLRKEAGLTQEATAEKCGIFRTYLSRIEAGTANPTIAVLLVLSEVLQVKITDLFEE